MQMAEYQALDGKKWRVSLACSGENAIYQFPVWSADERSQRLLDVNGIRVISQ